MTTYSNLEGYIAPLHLDVRSLIKKPSRVQKARNKKILEKHIYCKSNNAPLRTQIVYNHLIHM